MISVVMCVYNEKISWIKEAVNSILNQSIKDFEFIIVLDNPNAIELRQVLKDFAEIDNRVKVRVNSNNRGLAMSLNIGISMARGEYIARMDADDVALKDRLRIEKEFLDANQAISLLGTNIDYIDEDGFLILEKSSLVFGENRIKKALRFSNVFKHPTIMFRTKDIKLAGGYNDINPAQDYELITRMILGGYRVANIDVITLHYRRRFSSVSNASALHQMINAEYIRLNYRNHLMYSKEGYECFLKKRLVEEKKFEKSQEFIVKAENSRNKTLKIKYYLYVVIACFLSGIRRRKLINDKLAMLIKD